MREYGTPAKKRLSENETFLKKVDLSQISPYDYIAFLFDSSLTSEARSILPEELFHLRDCVDFLTFLCTSTGEKVQLIAEGQPVEWTTGKNGSDGGPYISHRSCHHKDRGAPFFKLLQPLQPALFQQIEKEYYGKLDIRRDGVYTIAATLPDVTPFPSFQKELRLIPSIEILQIDTALATFSAHPELLLDFKYRNFLEGILFSQGAQSEIHSTPTFSNTPHVIADFLNAQLPLAVASNNVELSLYLLRIYRRMYERASHSRPLFMDSIRLAFSTVEKQVQEVIAKASQASTSSLQSKYRFFWHYERARFLGCHETISSSDIDALLESVLLARRTVASEAPELEYDTGVFIHDVFARHEIQERLLSDISLLINTSLGRKDSKTMWTFDGASSYLSDDNPQLEYHLTSGALFVRNRSTSSIETPSSLLTSPKVQKATDGRLPPSITEESPGIYSCLIRSTRYRIETTADGMQIYKEIGDEWWQYLEEEELLSKRDTSLHGVLQKAIFENRAIWMILETAGGPRQKVQDFESKSLTIGVEHSQKVKATPSASDYGSKDCAFCPDPTAVSRFNKGASDLTAWLKKHPLSTITFIESLVLPKIQRPDAYVRVSSQIYSVLSAIMRGFSGTLWNKQTYSVPSVPSPEAVGKTVSILSTEKADVAVFSVSDKKALFAPNHGIIDIGGALKDEDNEVAARTILSTSTPSIVDGVIFYDTNKMLKVIDHSGTVIPLKECTLSIEKLTAYWAQPFITGSDLRLSSKAACMVCIGKDTIFRDLLQGVWRLRKLGKGQHIQFIVSEETKVIICASLGIPMDAPLKSNAIIAFTLKNQIDRQSQDNYRAVSHKANAILEHGFMRYILQAELHDLKEAFEQCKELFVRRKAQRPFDRYGARYEKIPTKTVIDQILRSTETSSACQFLCKKGVLHPEQVAQELHALEAMKAVLPEELPASSLDTRTMIQVQTQTQTQTQTAVSEEVLEYDFGYLVDLSKTLKARQRMPIDPLSLFENVKTIASRISSVSDSDDESSSSDSDDEAPSPVTPVSSDDEAPSPVSSDSSDDEASSSDESDDRPGKFGSGCIHLRDIFEFSPMTKEFYDLFPETVGTSINLYQVGRKWFSPVTRDAQPIEYALYVKGKEHEILIAINQTDAHELVCAKHFICQGCQTALINIHSGVTYPLIITHAGVTSRPDNLTPHDEFSLLLSRVSLKVLAGDLHLTLQEQLAFLAWVVRLGPEGFPKMTRFISSYICAIHPQAEEAKETVLDILTTKGQRLMHKALFNIRARAALHPELAATIDAMQKKVETSPDALHEETFIYEVIHLDTKTSQRH